MSAESFTQSTKSNYTYSDKKCEYFLHNKYSHSINLNYQPILTHLMLLKYF